MVNRRNQNSESGKRPGKGPKDGSKAKNEREADQAFRDCSPKSGPEIQPQAQAHELGQTASSRNEKAGESLAQAGRGTAQEQFSPQARGTAQARNGQETQT